jgi:hypothetical protein
MPGKTRGNGQEGWTASKTELTSEAVSSVLHSSDQASNDGHPLSRKSMSTKFRIPTEYAEGVMPDGVARSATLERMTALSLTGVARGRVSSWAVPGR